MADDGWLGNQACDPAKGKAKAASPEQLRGRPDLFAIMNQQVLQRARGGGGGGGAPKQGEGAACCLPGMALHCAALAPDPPGPPA